MRLGLALSLAAFAASAGCGRSPASGDGAPSQRLVPDAEIEAMRSKLQATLAANKARSCARPVLHGAAVPGRADDDLAALAEASGPLAACALASSAEVRDAVQQCDGPAERSTGPTTAPCRGRALDDPKSLEAPVLASTLACSALDDAVAGAVAHDDACSPYLPGRRALPSSFAGLQALARAVEVRGRHLAQEGETAASLRLLLDWVRAAQDLGRGGAGFLPAMLGTVAMAGPLAQLETVLGSNRLTEDELDALASAVDALVSSEPSVSEVLAGDRVDGVVTTILPELDAPPRAKRRDRLRAMPQGKSFASNPRDEIALSWLALEESNVAERAACPPSSTLEGCLHGLERAGRVAQQAAGRVDVVQAVRAPAAAARRAAVAVLRGVGADARLPFVRRLAQRLARLAALRLHVAVLRAAAADDGRCPDLAAYARPPLDSLRRPAKLGGELTVAAAGPDGVVDVALPAWIAPSLRTWTIRCPPAR